MALPALTHIVHSIAPHVGGPAVTVPALCEHLGRRGHDTLLRVVDDGQSQRPELSSARLTCHATVLGRGRFVPSLGLLAALREDASRQRILHSHGIWLPTNLAAHLAARAGQVPHVISPRGMLEPYAIGQKRLLKQITFATWQRRALEQASLIHVTAASELESVRRSGIAAPVAVIPNGVELPVQRGRACDERRVLLFLGRLHPKKGLDLLLMAWSQLAHRFPAWDLRIAGPAAPGYAAEMKGLARELGCERIEWCAPQYGAAKHVLYERSELFVLPTRSENFGVTVAEALAHGIPAVCTKAAPWECLEREGCGSWIEVGAEPLRVKLAELMNLSRDQLAGMGARGRGWVARELSWQAQSERMGAVYEWLQGHRPRPRWVDLSESSRAQSRPDTCDRP